MRRMGIQRRAFLKAAGTGAVTLALLPLTRGLKGRSTPMPATLHYIHPEHIIGDVHPFCYDGTWYLYYLAPGFHSKLMTSTDLIHWEQVPLTHGPRGRDDPELAPYYVLGVFQDHLTDVFRTYHGWSAGNMHCHYSHNLTHWEYAPPEYRVLAQYQRYSSQRDPYVFWNDTEDQYWCVMTCKVRGLDDARSGAVGYASSPDLRHWQGRGDLYFPGAIREPEVPQVFRIGDMWYLLASVMTGEMVGRPSYWMSAAPTGPWKTGIPDSLDGGNLQAAQVGFDGERWLLFGWIPLTTPEAHQRYTWGGHLAFPREVIRLANGELGARLEPAFGAAIRGEALVLDGTYTALPISGEWVTGATLLYTPAVPSEEGIAELPVRHDRLDIELAFTPDPSVQQIGIRLGQWAEVGWDRGRARWFIGGAHESRTYSELPFRPSNERCTLRIIIEEDMIELFANERYALCGRLPSQVGATTVRLFATGGPVIFDMVQLYALREVSAIAAV
jgi:sucrose-6-phosphate hydrolase SacC (GH32 family)